MLTWSNWHTEPRSNRYHYAKRFAKHLPVIFVQPDLEKRTSQYENTEINNLDILHVYEKSGSVQSEILNQALLARGFIKPLFWIYNPSFADYVIHRYSPLKIYHATEDYFKTDFVPFHQSEIITRPLLKLLSHIDLLIAVSEGVKESYLHASNYSGDCLVLPNGCDFGFWAQEPEGVSEPLADDKDYKKTVLYQGSINSRLDFDLIRQVVAGMPNWDFWFVGAQDDATGKRWKELLRHSNVHYLGKRTPEEVKHLTHAATVGIIPFVQCEAIWVSLPLKAFEYVACGLPVVTVPIHSLQPFPEIFQFARTPQEFIDSIEALAPSRYDASALKTRLDVAKEQDYDERFNTLVSNVKSLLGSKNPKKTPLNILILYDGTSTHINTLVEHLESFRLFSQHNIFYAIATHGAACEISLLLFDVIIIHYSVRVSLDWHLSRSYAEGLRRFGGYKILFIQDDYDTTEVARNWIKELGIHAVFTCVPKKYIESVYPSSRFPYVEFVETLTGYVPIRSDVHGTPKPLSERIFVIGYRGRPLSHWYGNLGREKLLIGKRMRQICEERGVVADIEWDDDSRIYGEGWYEFLGNCKAMIGTESGSNVFDEYGDIRKNIEKALEETPSLTYEEIYNRYLSEHEGKVMMNQISPRIFEAISLKTALVLFEGTYSGIVQPDIHYIPLKKDFSNIDEVFDKLADDSYLNKLTNRAYSDIVKSGKYSYRKFVQDLDRFISQRVIRGNGVPLVSGLIGSQRSTEGLRLSI